MVGVEKVVVVVVGECIGDGGGRETEREDLGGREVEGEAEMGGVGGKRRRATFMASSSSSSAVTSYRIGVNGDKEG